MRRLRGIGLAALLIAAGIFAGVAAARAQDHAQDHAPDSIRRDPAPGGSAAPQDGAAVASARRDTARGTAVQTARLTAILGRMHHGAMRQIQFGDLAEVRGETAGMRRYGAQLIGDFRAFNARLVAFAAELGIGEDRMAESFASQNVLALQREADELTRLANERGARFNADFWVVVAGAQSAAADVLMTAAGSDPVLSGLVVDMSHLLERSSAQALTSASR
jgi:hypothetical protein